MILKINNHIGDIRFSLTKTSWLYFILIPLIWIDFDKVTAQVVILSFILTCLTVGIGHSIGLHRGVIHKTYKTSKPFRNILVYLFVLTGLGSPLNWIKLHYYRDYWQNRLDCPDYFAYKHSILKDYWWNLHLQFTTNDSKRYAIPSEELNDKWIQWLHKTWYLHNLFLVLIILLFTDFNTLLVLMFLSIGLTVLGHWYIGYASHKYGYSRFKIKNANESAYNDVLLGLLSFGEGFHNNHHAHPTSAKFSLQ